MMKASFEWWLKRAGFLGLLGLLMPLVSGCVGSSNTAPLSGPPVYVLAVSSIANLHEQIPSISPADNNHVSSGTTGLFLTYNPETTVTLTAAPSDATGAFLGWCDASSTYSNPFVCAPPPCTTVSGLTCTVKMTANLNLLATYPGVTGVTVTPGVATATVPSTTQFTAMVTGLGTYGNNLPYQGSPYMFSIGTTTNFGGSLGTISATGLYTTSYPAPASVTIQAQSTVAPQVTYTADLTLSLPPAGTGPALTVDAGTATHAISPNIYGMNSAGLDPTIPAFVGLSIDRWGGNTATRYNYSIDTVNTAGGIPSAPQFFENKYTAMNGYPIMSQFNSQLTQDRLTKTATLATVPLIGYTSSPNDNCSFSVAKYGTQTAVDGGNKDCGNGVLQTAVNGTTAVKNDPTDTSMVIDQTFVGGWVQFLDTTFMSAANGGVGFYGLDNEPEVWNVVDKDVHPAPMSYDELSKKGIAYAAAIKAQDAGALVTGPVISNWYNYFYSAADVASGSQSSPACPQANPTDRLTHGNVPLVEYYLQQFQAYETAHSIRLLDYVDLHTYFAASGAYTIGAASLTGNTTLQQARLNSTRVFWDLTYTDPNYTDPTNSPTTVACKGQPYAPNVINLMKGWVAKDYPGTKLAISEYNWGGEEAISGALAQADILGIFGREGLDMAMLAAPAASINGQQQPGVIGFQAFTNYDGKSGHFGETAVTSTSANQGVLAVYGATRAADDTLTIVVLNKGYADLTSAISLPNLKTSSSAKSYLYSSSNLAAIVPQANVPVTAPVTTGGPSSIASVFPAQSITVLIVPRS